MGTFQQPAETENILEKVISQAIKQETERLVKDAMKELERRTPELIAGITVDLMKMTEFQIMQDRIVFTIKKV